MYHTILKLRNVGVKVSKNWLAYQHGQMVTHKSDPTPVHLNIWFLVAKQSLSWLYQAFCMLSLVLMAVA